MRRMSIINSVKILDIQFVAGNGLPAYTKKWFVAAAMGFALLGPSHGVDDRQDQLEDELPSTVATPPTNPFRTLDDRLVSIGMVAPFFGGMHLDDEAETLIVHMAEGAKRTDIARVRSAVLSEFSVHELTTDQIVTVPARYSILELDDWQRRMVRLLDMQGIVFTDMNEGRNRVEVGVTDDVDESDVRARLARLDIPSEAVVITRTEPIALALLNRHRPVVGGIRMTPCTIGFTNWHIEEDALGYISAGHCTEEYGEVDGTPLYQPLPDDENWDENLVGIEVLDPPGFTNAEDPNCPPGRVCRYSDAAWFLNTSAAALPPIGYIAWPPLQSNVWDGVSKYRVTDKADGIMGAPVQKVGKVTGRTRGIIVNTCVDIGGIGAINKLCQMRVAATDVPLFVPGDSGSPAFSILNFGGEAQINGIFWGYSSPEVAVFSPISGIEADLGVMNVCAPNDFCPPSL